MRIRMDLPAGVRPGRVAKAAYALRARRGRTTVRRIDGQLIRIELYWHGQCGSVRLGDEVSDAKAEGLLVQPKLVSSDLGAQLKAQLAG